MCGVEADVEQAALSHYATGLTLLAGVASEVMGPGPALAL